jgi:hypothetical protein
MTFEEWFRQVVKIEALRAFVENAPHGAKRAQLEQMVWADPKATWRVRESYRIEAKVLGY